jgi:hypothetical protein
MSNSSILITKLGGKNMNIKTTRTVKAIKAAGCRNLLLIICFVLAVSALSACGKTKLVGSWYADHDEDIVFNIMKDGTVAAYDNYLDEVTFGEWKSDGEICTLVGLEEDDVIFVIENDDKLYNKDYAITLTRGDDKVLPYVTQDELASYCWYTTDERYELEFYFFDGESNEWNLYDYSTDEYVYEGIYEIDEDSLTITTEEGKKFNLKISHGRDELSGLDDLVFERDE